MVTIESLLKRTDNIRFNLRITTELPVSRQLLWFLIVLPSMMHPKSFLTISLISFLLKSKKRKITCLLWCVNRSISEFVLNLDKWIAFPSIMRFFDGWLSTLLLPIILPSDNDLLTRRVSLMLSLRSIRLDWTVQGRAS